MRTTQKFLVGTALVGLAAAGGAAFTGAGVTNGQATQFVGGTVSQTVTGATMNSVLYGFTDASNIAVNKITVNLTGATGKTVTGLVDGAESITFTDTTALGGTASDGVFESDLDATPYSNLDTLAITVA